MARVTDNESTCFTSTVRHLLCQLRSDAWPIDTEFVMKVPCTKAELRTNVRHFHFFYVPRRWLFISKWLLRFLTVFDLKLPLVLLYSKGFCLLREVCGLSKSVTPCSSPTSVDTVTSTSTSTKHNRLSKRKEFINPALWPTLETENNQEKKQIKIREWLPLQ